MEGVVETVEVVVVIREGGDECLVCLRLKQSFSSAMRAVVTDM